MTRRFKDVHDHDHAMLRIECRTGRHSRDHDRATSDGRQVSSTQ